jgi:hypothetical protein
LYIQLLNAATATNSAPSGATAGVAKMQRTENSPCGIGEAESAMIIVRSTAGSGTMTCTLKLWCYSPISGTWHPLGTHATPATKGIINAGAAIGETGADTIAHAELVQGLGGFTRFYLEITAIGGTATAISAWLVHDGVAS